ncbi:MAG: response regulator [Gammaproteobacteria bacterium]|nr:MAG: response regulator [Gammaproteobacteria bacterium]
MAGDTQHTRKMLIVDDSRLARLMIRRSVEKYYPNWEITEAINADDATFRAPGIALDIITLDMNMPGQDGLSFAPSLRKMHPEAKIALLTANIQPAVQKRAKELGLYFIPKPIKPERLLPFLQLVANIKTT